MEYFRYNIDVSGGEGVDRELAETLGEGIAQTFANLQVGGTVFKDVGQAARNGVVEYLNDTLDCKNLEYKEQYHWDITGASYYDIFVQYDDEPYIAYRIHEPDVQSKH